MKQAIVEFTITRHTDTDASLRITSKVDGGVETEIALLTFEDAAGVARATNVHNDLKKVLGELGRRGVSIERAIEALDAASR